MNRTLMAVVILVSSMSLAFAEETPDEEPPHNVYGLWQLESGSVDVKIADCGDGTPCGTMIRVDSDQDGIAVDRFNNDPQLAKRPLVGLKMLSGFERYKNGWKGGTIYNARNGKSYTSKIMLNSDGTLKVKGCVGPICKTQTWLRITD